MSEPADLERVKAAILQMLTSLPVDSHDQVLAQLADVAARVDEPDGMDRLAMFARRLVQSVRVRQDPLFEKFAAEAREGQAGAPQPMTGAELIAALRDR